MVSRKSGVASVSLSVAVLLGAGYLVRWNRRRKYDGLEGIVSFSARMIASSRAVEAEEVDRLFDDPLARVLAGNRAMRRAELRVKESEVEGGVAVEGSPYPRRRRKIDRTALRTLWFDRALLAALDAARHPRPLVLDLVVPSNGGGGGGGGVSAVLRPRAVAPRQVVLLGAGMDSRAWRLPLPEGVAWFEVDRADVLGAKQRTLAAAGAAFTASKASAAHPLESASWTPLAVDLGHRGWTTGLMAQGFDADVATVWLAEGLLMYLQPAAVDAMLREMAEVSAPGSVLLAMSVTEALVRGVASSDHVLVQQFVFGCAPDPTKWLRRLGWCAESVDTRADMVRSWNIPEKQVDSNILLPLSANSKSSLFIVASH